MNRLACLRTALAVACTLVAASAAAQTPAPLPPFVVDVRWVADVSLGQDPTTAADLFIDQATLSKRGAGLGIGAHVYPIRRHGFAIGVGEEILLAHATAKNVTDTNGVTGDITRHIRGFSTVVSANFGGHDGWSYLSLGAGPVRFDTANTAVAHTAVPFKITPNFGGGARWFLDQHVAVGFDVRAYFTPAVGSTPTAAGKVKSRLLVIAVGLTFR